jgi:hypothetical protein
MALRSWIPFIALLIIACDDESPQVVPDTDAEVHAAADAAAPDLGQPDLGPDAAPVDQPCTWPSDCPAGDCVDGLCLFEQPARCFGSDQTLCAADETCGGYFRSYWCERACEVEQTCAQRPRTCDGHPDCPDAMSCHDGRCINSCFTDLDCPTGGYCMQGECVAFDSVLGTGDVVHGLAPEGDGLYAGVAVRPLDFPVGVSAAGYGGRPGPTTPYAFALGGSEAVLERQDVRSIVLSTATDTLVLLRLPLSWSTDYLITQITEKVRRLTIDDAHPEGLDLSGKIVTFATHSHSQPGRYWNMVPETGFGAFGYGLFSPEMHDRYTTSFALTVHAALQDLQPAQAGWTVLDEMDPDRRIHSDRRNENPPLVDDRMMVLRVDDREGTPLAGLMNFAVHGTHMETTWLTGDVPGAVEVVATQKLSALAGHPVPVLFANGNAGDISPRGDDLAAPSFAKIQVVGHRVWPIFRDAFQGIETSAELPIEVVTRRVPIDYDTLGYDRETPEFVDRLGDPQTLGAFQCVSDGVDHTEPPHEDGALHCRINLQKFLGAPVVQLHRTVLSAFRIGSLIVTTLPGEPTSSLGLRVSAQVEADAEAAGWIGARVVNFGYSQDHHTYLLLADDWMHGGYEASMGTWGWRLGPYVVEQSRQTAALLFTDAREDTHSEIKPTWWPELEDDTVQPTPSPRAGEVISEPGDATRGDLIELQWIGGHPGADLPEVHLEHEVDGTWSPALDGGGLALDTRGFETLVSYRGDYETDHAWSIRWELPFDLAEGRWRIVVNGHTDVERSAYQVASGAFTVSAATLTARDVVHQDGQLALKLNYPQGPSNNDGASAFDTLEPTGHLLRIDTERAGRGLPGALKAWSFLLGPALPIDAPVSVRFDDGAPVETIAHDDQTGLDLVIGRDAAGVESTQRLEGWFSSRVELDVPADAQRATLTDAHGNHVTVQLR